MPIITPDPLLPVPDVTATPAAWRRSSLGLRTRRIVSRLALAAALSVPVASAAEKKVETEVPVKTTLPGKAKDWLQIGSLQLKFHLSSFGGPFGSYHVKWQRGTRISVDGVEFETQDFSKSALDEIAIIKLELRGKVGPVAAACTKTIHDSEIGSGMDQGAWSTGSGATGEWAKYYDDCDAAQAKGLFKEGFPIRDVEIVAIEFSGLHKVREEIEKKGIKGKPAAPTMRPPRDPAPSSSPGANTVVPPASPPRSTAGASLAPAQSGRGHHQKKDNFSGPQPSPQPLPAPSASPPKDAGVKDDASNKAKTPTVGADAASADRRAQRATEKRGAPLDEGARKEKSTATDDAREKREAEARERREKERLEREAREKRDATASSRAEKDRQERDARERRDKEHEEKEKRERQREEREAREKRELERETREKQREEREKREREREAREKHEREREEREKREKAREAQEKEREAREKHEKEREEREKREKEREERERREKEHERKEKEREEREKRDKEHERDRKHR
jgi:hypothetical protein